MAIPAQTATKTKVAATPTTKTAATASYIDPAPPAKTGVAVTTGGSAGHGGVGSAVGTANYTTTYVATTTQVSIKPKTVVAAAPVAAVTVKHPSDYR